MSASAHWNCYKNGTLKFGKRSKYLHESSSLSSLLDRTDLILRALEFTQFGFGIIARIHLIVSVYFTLEPPKKQGSLQSLSLSVSATPVDLSLSWVSFTPVIACVCFSYISSKILPFNLSELSIYLGLRF